MTKAEQGIFVFPIIISLPTKYELRNLLEGQKRRQDTVTTLITEKDGCMSMDTITHLSAEENIRQLDELDIQEQLKLSAFIPGKVFIYPVKKKS